MRSSRDKTLIVEQENDEKEDIYPASDRVRIAPHRTHSLESLRVLRVPPVGCLPVIRLSFCACRRDRKDALGMGLRCFRSDLQPHTPGEPESRDLECRERDIDRLVSLVSLCDETKRSKWK